MRVFLLFILSSIVLSCNTASSEYSTTSALQGEDTAANREAIRASAALADSSKEAGAGKAYPDSLDIKIGQMILIGIGEKTHIAPSDSLVRDLRNHKIGGVVLFEKNISPDNASEALKKMITDLNKEVSIPLFVSIDEEGGKVHRLKEKYGFIAMPSAAYLGELDHADSTLFHHRKLGALMSSLGFNMNFAPTVDLAINLDNPIIAKAGRSFSANPAQVSKHAMHTIDAHHENNIISILKHFPGHGSSSEDSHLGIVDVSEQWSLAELLPYDDIIRSGKCQAIMTAHIINKKIDPQALPATLSGRFVKDILRNLLGFQGLVISDDMQMHAISKNYGFENAIQLAINAGVDVLLFGNNVNAKEMVSASRIHQVIRDLVDNGEVSEERIEEAYRRIIKLKTSASLQARSN